MIWAVSLLTYYLSANKSEILYLLIYINSFLKYSLIFNYRILRLHNPKLIIIKSLLK